MNKSEVLSATSLLLSIAKSDDIIEESELKCINDIIIDFFQLDSQGIGNKIIEESLKNLNQSTDIFEFGRALNNIWTYEDKIDFITCTFEVALSDNNMHYLEDHTIKKISGILNINHKDLINSKMKLLKKLR